MRDDKINELESELICEALEDFIDAMRDELDASDAEIRKSVLKELEYKLAI